MTTPGSHHRTCPRVAPGFGPIDCVSRLRIGERGTSLHLLRKLPLRNPDGLIFLPLPAPATWRPRRKQRFAKLTHPFYVKNGWVPAPLITGRVVSALGLRQAGIAADVSNADAASFRVSSELTAPAPRGELATPGSRRGHNLLPLMGGESALVASDAVLAVERTGLSWHAEVVQPSWETERRPSLPPPREIS